MSEKKIILKSSDGLYFEVNESMALKSKTITNVIDEKGTDNAISIAKVEGNILELVIEYCEKHIESDESLTEETKEDLKKWDTKFMKMEKSILFGIVHAANDLKIEDLLALSCKSVADMIKGKTPQEIRTQFNIKNDFTKEEEEENRRCNSWAFDD